MSSKFIEDTHATLLQALIDDLGLECTRSPEVSDSAEEIEEGTLEEQDQREEEIKIEGEEEIEEEEVFQAEEEIQDDYSGIFPTPSLRKYLPDKIRKFEEQNRIHVLPTEFKSNIDEALIPKIALTAQQRYIAILGDIVGCNHYKNSLAEFWFLDTLANLLRRAQEDLLNRRAQAALILWFCEWMKEIQNFDAADRQRMLTRFKENMLASARFIVQEERLPSPAEAGVCYKQTEEQHDSIRYAGSTLTGTSVAAAVQTDAKSPLQVSFANPEFACSLIEMTKIFHYIYDLFSTEYQFNLVRSVFTFTPDYMLIDMPYQLQNPKTLYTALKVKPKKEKSPKKDAKLKKKKEPDTEEYLALMELKAKEERELDEQEELDRQDYHLRSHILPLNFAATDELFDKYWPPPPPPEPEVVPEPEPKLKRGKGKK